MPKAEPKPNQTLAAIERSTVRNQNLPCTGPVSGRTRAALKPPHARFVPTRPTPYPTRARTKFLAPTHTPVPDPHIEQDENLATSTHSKDSVSEWTVVDDSSAQNEATIQLNALSHMNAPIPTILVLTISAPFIAEVLAVTADFDSSRPITVHLPFVFQLVTSLDDAHQLNIQNPHTNEAFMGLMPLASSTVVQRAARAANAGIGAALMAYFESSFGDGNEEVRLLRVGELEEGLWDVYFPVLYSWAQDWDPGVAQWQDSRLVELSLRLLLEKSELANVVGGKMRRIIRMLRVVLIWWHRHYSVGISRDVRGWRKEELEKWLEGQVEVWMPND